ncbi:hypothetical protein CL633_04560 [bacterium]|jgi:hypothetical protein|nr:hypothetical protein [bacterium]|tara:strand:+ start:7868 stop:9043 length:1176 start_codon:yes stop_codon:yes gene_type:complete
MADQIALRDANRITTLLAEAKDFDGSALPNTVSEGEIVRVAATMSGIVFTMPVNEDGSKTLVLTEDAQHASGDPGVQLLAVRNDTLAALAGTDGDYAPLQVDASGALYVSISGETIDLDVEGAAAHDAAVTGNPLQIAFESAQIDGSALSNAVNAEGDVTRPKVSQEGVVIVTLAQEDGSNSPIIAHDTAIASGFGGSVLIQGMEARDFDGAAISTAVAEGDAVRPIASLNGVQYMKLISEDGSQSVEDEVNNAINVQEIANTRDNTNGGVVVQAATAPADNNENQIGGNIDVSNVKGIGVSSVYVKGDETKVTYTFYGLLRAGGAAIPIPKPWATGANATSTLNTFDQTASATDSWDLDVARFKEFQIKAIMSDGTPTGTIAVEIRTYNN